MSKLREAAKAALTAYEKFRDVDDIDGLDDAMDRLRAALAQPETEAQPVVEPVAWESRWIDPEEGPSDWVPTQNPDFYRSRPNFEVRELYANPPRDEWRPASEPPESLPRDYLLKKLAMVMPLFEEARDALTAISEQQRAVRCISPTLADRMDMAGTYSIDDWRDVTPPTESPIAAKCQRIEGSGEICGLTPPCPDCGPSLIDVAEGA